MILCGGDSFSKFDTPVGQYTAEDIIKKKELYKIDVASGLSAVELLMERYNIAGTSIGWAGASIDATVANAIHYITNHNDVKFLFFYLTVNVRIMYSAKTTDNYHYADNGHDDPDFFNNQEICNVHSNDSKCVTPEAYKYFLHQPAYKKYYDRYAYLNFLTNVCKNRGINILYIRTSNNELDTSLFSDNTDNTKIINIDFPPDMHTNSKKRHSNHLFPQEQKAFFRKILNKHESFILESLQK